MRSSIRRARAGTRVKACPLSTKRSTTRSARSSSSRSSSRPSSSPGVRVRVGVKSDLRVNVQRNLAAQYRRSSGQSTGHGRSGPAQSTTAACCSWFAVPCPLSTRATVWQAVKCSSNSG